MRRIRKLVELLGAISLATAMACWFQYGGIYMSWAGERPLTPNASTGQVMPIQNHGTMYVSQADIDFAHSLVAPGLTFGAIGLVLIALSRIIGDQEAQSTPSSTMKAVGTIAELAFIAFLPIWLFANPFTALARNVSAADSLLVIDIAIGALMVAWWSLMNRGALFEKLRSLKT